MPYKVNPHTGNLTYYERGVPSGGTPGKVLSVDVDGATVVWKDGTDVMSTSISNPPSGMFRVTNLYVDSATGKLTVEYDDTPVP